jgi:transposase
MEGVPAFMTVEGATGGDVLETFVEQVQVPRLDRDDIVVLDDVGAHRPPSVLERIRGAGAHVTFLPPCSPDVSPTEPCWAKLKQLPERLEALTAPRSIPRSPAPSSRPRPITLVDG